MRIGRYEIRGLLGRGGMGAVYKAAMPVTGRMVALKVLRPAEILEDLMGLDALTSLFLTETVTMAGISHPNVASVLDVCPGDGRHPDDGGVPPHFSMEYFCGNLGVLMGETYEVERPSRRLGAAASLHFARQMLEGLARLHYEDIVHRDIKPFNVMLAEDEGGPGTVKLIDFGLSRLRGETPPRHPGMVVGSPYYTAPEQEADPDSADARADLFSVAVTLHRMLTGRLPGAPVPHGVTGADSLLTEPDLAGPDWDGFFSRALAPAPGDRFQDAWAMLAALDGLEAAWRSARDAACSGLDLLNESSTPPLADVPRSEAVKVGLRAARDIFGLDELWQPLRPPAHRFTDNEDGTVAASADGTGPGLIWEKHGSRYPLTWERAQAHVDRLNAHAYAGRTGWRLPTVDELTTIIARGAQPGQSCLPPAFDPRKARLWSRDLKAYTAAWYVDAELGFVWWQDRTCRFFARAVCPA
jgi:serine/threonine-protein kinase